MTGLDTESEMLFTRLCTQLEVAHERISIASLSQERRSDFCLTGHRGGAVLVEVKQFNPTPEDAHQGERLLAGETVVRGGTPGARLRSVIDRANQQLKALSNGAQPGLLVVYNNVVGGGYHTEPYAVLTAMRGLDVVPAIVPSDPSKPVTFLKARPGPKKKLRADANTHISGIGILAQHEDFSLHLLVYHNPHARTPLDPADLCSQYVQHFAMRHDESGWDPIFPSA